jgi:hypothetical protein
MSEEGRVLWVADDLPEVENRELNPQIEKEKTLMAPITNARLANCGKLLLGLVLALAVVFGSREITAQAQTQAIDLNTGYKQVTTSLIPFLQQDDDWQVTADPINTALPRPAIVVDNLTSGTHFNWLAPIPNSQWISADANKYRGALQPPRKSFTHKMCFNLPALFSAPQLTMRLRADDIVRQVLLNSNTIFIDTNPNAAASATKPGSHLGPLLSISHSQSTDFRAGENCLDVVVEDVQQIITGLNLAGRVTYNPVDRRVVSLPPCPRGRVVGSVVADLSTGTTGNPPLDVVPSQADPKWFLLSSPGNPNPSTAYVTSSVWSIDNTTQPANWIQRSQSGTAQADAPGNYTYKVPFALNTSLYSSIQLTLRYAADNAASVRLNGGTFAGCQGPNCFSSWQGPMTLSSGFSNGVNSLDVVVTNNSPANDISQTGLIVDARLIATCR